MFYYVIELFLFQRRPVILGSVRQMYSVLIERANTQNGF